MSESISIPTDDGQVLSGTLHRADQPRGAVVVHGATGVPHPFYQRFAAHLASRGWSTVTYDYRGIGASAPHSLRGFEASMTDWGLRDMPAAVAWAVDHVGGNRLFIVGHSVGGQLAGLMPDPSMVAGMVGMSAQSGHWRHQGGNQRAAVAFHVFVTLPVLIGLFGYAPWSRVAGGEDLPAGVGRQWASWCRDPDYVLGDTSLPLERFAAFTAPVLAYSIDDDDWGTPHSVDAMMRAYPNVERRHISPADVGVDRLGHTGAFRAGAESLWDEIVDWFDRH